MKIAVTGGWDFYDYDLFCRVMDKLHPTTLMTGGESGVDTVASRYAQDKNIECVHYEADYEGRGSVAAHFRNRKLLVLNPDTAILVAFPGRRPDKNNFINQARNRRVAILIIPAPPTEKTVNRLLRAKAKQKITTQEKQNGNH